MPRGHDRKPIEREELVARLATDAAGRFESSAELDPGRYYPGSRLVVLATDAGLMSRYVREGEAEVSLKVHPEVVIRAACSRPAARRHAASGSRC